MRRPGPEEVLDQRCAQCFAPAHDAGWCWSADGSAVQWRNGGTIALRAEIAAVLQGSVDLGWPCFDAIVLLLAACRPGWPQAISVDGRRIHELVEDAARRDPGVAPWHERCLAGLAAVNNLHEARRRTTAAKTALVRRLCLQGRPRWTAEVAGDLARRLGDGLTAEQRADRATPWWPALRDALFTLATGLHGVGDEAVALEVDIGVDALPSAAALPPCAPEVVRALIDRLADDAEHAGLARVARDLLAAVARPRRLDEPDELATGGFSDLANRGQPDRLLAGELAHDDLVLAVRLALGEALYLRRETPPRAPQGGRSLLVDTGIRAWGVARLYAAAAALAFAAGDGRRAVRCWRSAADGAEAVEIGTRDGLVALLGALDAAVEPSHALASWLAASGDDDRVLITTSRALADPGLARGLAAVGYDGLVATLDPDGRYRLLAWSPAGVRTEAEAMLDLARLVPTPRVTASMGETGAWGSLWPCPLRVPHRVAVDRCATTGDGTVVSVSPTGELGRWDRAGWGPVLLARGVPAGRVVAVDPTHGDERVVVCRGDRTVVCLPDGAGRVTEIALDGIYPARHAWFAGEAVVTVDRCHLRVHDLAGRCQRQLALPEGAVWRHQRFLQGRTGWFAATWSGGALAIEPVARIPRGMGPASVFSRSDQAGLWCLRGLMLHHLDLGTVQELPVPPALGLRAQEARAIAWRPRALSADGERVILDDGRGRFAFGIDLRTRRFLAPQSQELEPAVHERCLAQHGRLANLRGLAVAGGTLVLTTGKGTAHRLEAGARGATLALSGRAPQERILALIAGGPRHARWWRADRDGVEVRVDGSGVLECIDRRDSLPALAIVCANGPTALWSGDGVLHGPPRFLGERASQPPPHELLRAYARRLA